MAEYRGGDEAEAGAVGFFASPILPETNSEFTPEIGNPKRKVIFQPSMFRCYVSFREGESRWRNAAPERWQFVRGHDKPRLMNWLAIDPFQVVYIAENISLAKGIIELIELPAFGCVLVVLCCSSCSICLQSFAAYVFYRYLETYCLSTTW